MPETLTAFTKSAEVKNALSVMRAIAHPLRLRMMSFIHQNGTVNVNKIYAMLRMEQSIASQHLRILRDAALVQTSRDGKFIFYSLNYPKIEQIHGSVQEFLKAESA
jgi:DNA-binding transcriptional ArsR family regulator